MKRTPAPPAVLPFRAAAPDAPPEPLAVWISYPRGATAVTRLWPAGSVCRLCPAYFCTRAGDVCQVAVNEVVPAHACARLSLHGRPRAPDVPGAWAGGTHRSRGRGRHRP